VLPLDSPLTSSFRATLLGGVQIITDNTRVAIPYFAWSNRGPGEMVVWTRHEQR